MSNSNYQAEIVSFGRSAFAERELDLGIQKVGSPAQRVVWSTASQSRVVWSTASVGRVVWSTASNGFAQGRVSIAA
jgi:hypothetical protein